MFEVLVSSVILSICLVMILDALVTSARAIRISEDYFKASLLLESKLFDVYNMGAEGVQQRGVFKDFSGRFRWELDVEKLDEYFFDFMELSVSWERRSQQRHLSLTSYL